MNNSQKTKRRVLLKISGEALIGSGNHGIDGDAIQALSQRISSLHQSGCHIALVIGGGNIFRGIQNGEILNIPRTAADHMGMLATIINGIALSESLNAMGSSTRLLTALDCPNVAEKFQWHQAINLFNQGTILLLVGGTGQPYFTTDTAAALRGSELNVDIVLKATSHVDGIYESDPRSNPKAKKFDRLTYTQLIERKLKVMDLTAVTMCMNSQIPIRVFNLKESFEEAVSEKATFGTLVCDQ